MATVQPVFIKQKDIPDFASARPTVLEMCLSAERTSGQGSILGAQDIRGLWRIYPATKEARSVILIQGIRLRGVSLQVSNTNPFLLRDDTGEEKPTTKVWVDNIPISVADSEIELALVKVGCELRSAIKQERARDLDNKLTRFLTGRRFVFVSLPSTPLDKNLKVSFFTANIFHKEQKLVKKPVICSRCLDTTHHVSMCTNEVVCRECKLPGHKRGDPECGFSGEQTDRQTDNQLDKDSARSVKESEQIVKKRAGVQKTHPPKRQTTLNSVFDVDHPSRTRSETPKRGRSRDRRSPKVRSDKQPRREEGLSPDPATNDSDHERSECVSGVWE